jgi:hypothetical protein
MKLPRRVILPVVLVSVAGGVWLGVWLFERLAGG